MFVANLFQKLFGRRRSRGKAPPVFRQVRPNLDALENRCVPAIGLNSLTLPAPLLGSVPVSLHVAGGDALRLETDSVFATLPGAEVRAEYDPSRGLFRVVGTNGDDQFRVVESAGRISVEVFRIVDPADKVGNHGQYFATDIETPTGPVRSVDASQLKKIEIRGWDGKDSITFEYHRPAQREGGLQATDFTLSETGFPANLDVEIFGGFGNDELKVDGSGGKAWGGTSAFNPVSLHGGAGDDTLIGSIGDELLEGGADNDTLIGNGGSDELHGNGGHDTLFGDSDSAPYADDGNDKLFGDTGVDTMHGGGGNDTLVGGSGNDFLHGDDGHDTLFGDQGLDSAVGYSGNDHLYGGDGEDKLFGQAGDDYLDGGANSNDLTPDDHIRQTDQLFGQLGNDTLIGGPVGDWGDYLHGGADADVFHVRYQRPAIESPGPQDPLGFAVDYVADYREGEDELVKIDNNPPPTQGGSGTGDDSSEPFGSGAGYPEPDGPEPPMAGNPTPVYGGGLPLGL